MAKQTINTGGFVDDPSAESVLSAFTKVNAMTSELFTTFSLGGRLAIDLDTSPDTIRAAFVKTNTNLSALYADQSLPGVPVINVGAALDDAAAESMYAAFTKVNQGMTALYDATAPIEVGDYYVATTGADSNAGTVTHPFRTINKGVSVLGPGKTLLVRAGTYVEALAINKVPAGTSWGAAVRIAAYPNETVWMKPASGNRVLDFEGNQQYIEFDGINLNASNCLYDGAKINATAVGKNAHHIRLKNLEIIGVNNTVTDRQFHAIATALFAEAIGGNEFINLTTHGGGHEDFSVGIYICSANNLIEYCEIYDTAGVGIQITNNYTSATSSNNTFRYNVIHDNRVYGRARGIIVSRGNGNKIYGNVIYNIHGAAGSALCGGIALYSTSVSNTEIYNNTIEGSDHGINIDAGVTGTILRNNIAYNSDGANLVNNGTGTVQSHNLFGTTNPLFVNAGAANFRLQAGSPARNAGTTVAVVTTDLDGTARPQEGTYDIGAYEYVP